MDQDKWTAAIERLVAEQPECKHLRFVLEACTAELKDGKLVIKAPGSFYAGCVRDAAPILRRQYCTADIEVIADDQLKKDFFARHSMPESPVATLTESQAAKPSRKDATGYRTQYFDISDSLADQYCPKKNPYLVTEANQLAHATLEKRVLTFPALPEERAPIMLWSDIGQGKTHLLQKFAWQLHDTIIAARGLLEKEDFTGARKLLNLKDAAEEDVRTVLRRTAASRIRYITAETLTREYRLSHVPDAWKGEKLGSADAYKTEREQWYSGVNWFFLDDIHAFGKGEKTGTIEWTYTFVDQGILTGRVIVSAIDCNPNKLIKEVEKKSPSLSHDLERLFTRLYSGGLIEIAPPMQYDIIAVFRDRLTRLDSQLANQFDQLPGESVQKQFANRIKSYRNAVEVAISSHKYALEGLPLERAITKALEPFPPNLDFSKPATDLFS